MNVAIPARTAEAFLHAAGWAVSKDREWFSPDGHISTFQLNEAVVIQVTTVADDAARAAA